MIVIVTGGRDYTDRGRVESTLSKLHSIRRIKVVRQGACPTGADMYAREWARRYDVTLENYPADWERYGAVAGPLRNRVMALAKPRAGICLAFPGGRGTLSMVCLADSAGIFVLEVEA